VPENQIESILSQDKDLLDNLDPSF
jgi:hypothetical protein